MAKTEAAKIAAEMEAERDLDALRLTPALRAAAMKVVESKKTRRST